MMLKRLILTLAERFADLTGSSLGSVSNRAFGDSRILHRVQRGKGGMTLARADRALAWFSENWPAAAEWPAGVPRPVEGCTEVACQ